MFNIEFKNEKGIVKMGGGTSNDVFMRITAVDGLTLPGKTYTTAKYINQPGQITTATAVNARTITISGDAVVDSEFQAKYANVMTVLNDEGYLIINIGSISRKIKCKCADFANGERNGAYQLMTMQFICDYPYFEDVLNTVVGVFSVVPLFGVDFTYEGMFSTKTTGGVIEYKGNVETEPTFYVTVENATDTSENYGLYLHNKTTGEEIKLKYKPKTGEYITIDVANRKIYNSEGANLIKYITDDTFLDGFHLIPGSNDIEIYNYATSDNLIIACEYSCRYLEAVY